MYGASRLGLLYDVVESNTSRQQPRESEPIKKKRVLAKTAYYGGFCMGSGRLLSCESIDETLGNV